MKIYTLEQTQDLPIKLDEAWAFFSTPRNLDEITPKDIGFRIESISGEKMYEGQIITYKIKVFPFVWISWVTEIKSVKEQKSFVDEQRFGPYALWHHRHTFETRGDGTRMTDLVHYAIGWGPFGRIAHFLFVRKKLEGIFGFRQTMLNDKFKESKMVDLTPQRTRVPAESSGALSI